MSNRNLFILGLTAVVIAVMAVAVSKISSKPYTKSATSAAYLIQGLDPDQIAKITILASRGKQVELTRRGADFVVASLDNDPALTDEINKLITTCLDIQTSQLYTDNPANFKDLGVAEEGARLVVKFYKADANGSTSLTTGSPTLLTGIIIGKQREKGSVGYIRRASDNSVYVMAGQVPWIKNRSVDYVDQQLAAVKREDINSITVSDLNESYVLKPDGKTVLLENLPEDKKLKEDVAEKVITVLTDLKFDDVNAESTLPPGLSLKFGRKYSCQLKDSTEYSFWLAKEGDIWFTKCDARFLDKTPVTKTQGQVESEEELKKKETKLLARDAADEFLEKHNGWVYQIPDYKAIDMTKPLAELVEDANKPPAVGFDKLTTGEPKETTVNE